MLVYKFGGASVKDAEGVANLKNIVADCLGGINYSGGEDTRDGILVIVSAMGKTTNGMEQVLECFIGGDKKGALSKLGQIRECHEVVCEGLFPGEGMPARAAEFFAGLEKMIRESDPAGSDYDYWYDMIVPYGELISTSIIASYLEYQGLKARWLDMRKLFLTDDRHRDANIDLNVSRERLIAELSPSVTENNGVRVWIGQGFIGASSCGETTTLGREGSDYSAAAAAYMTDAQSLTIWKDVEGILNADPKYFADTVLIPRLSFLDAIELAYSGAQIIHPKTIKPLQNKNIPLYVRPFGNPSGTGSIIRGDKEGEIEVPVLILKHNQVLLSIRPKDFSFVLEERLAEIFTLMEQYRIKINLIQSSAVNLSMSVDRTRKLPELLEELGRRGFRTVYNENTEMLTIRGYDERMLEKYSGSGDILLTQKTRRILRIVRRAGS